MAASIWTENINLALDIAPKIKAGVIWINSTNLFDAACGFGGYKESGFGREGGSEGIRTYTLNKLPTRKIQTYKTQRQIKKLLNIDRTPNYILEASKKDLMEDILFQYMELMVRILYAMLQDQIERMSETVLK